MAENKSKKVRLKVGDTILYPEIAPDSVVTDKIKDGGVTTSKIGDGAVTETKVEAELLEKVNAGNAHAGNKNNPHGVTAAQVGLGNVDNTSDADKPVSTATQTALDKKVDKVTGKGLSTNDYTTEEKNKLAGVDDGANRTIVDSTLLSESTHAVMNKVVKAALDGKADVSALDGKADVTALDGYSKTGHKHTVSDVTDFPVLATVATSGKYSDLAGKPTIPTVNNAKITVTQGGVEKGSFTLNQSGAATIDIDKSDGMTQAEADKRYQLKGASNEKVVIEITPSDGGDISGAVIEITRADDGTLIDSQAWQGKALTAQVTGGTVYKLSIKSLPSSYFTPQPRQFMAVADTTRTVRFVVNQATPGVYIEMTDGSWYTADNYTGGLFASNNEVNSILVLTSSWTGRILPDAELHSKTMYWTPSEPGEQVSGTMNSSSYTAEADMDGAGNTSKLLAKYGEAVTSNFAAGYAYNKIFRSGKHGYLPSLGELKMIYANATEVNKCLAKLIGQNDCIGAHWFWSSTQSDSSNAWYWSTRSYDGNWYSSFNVLVLSAL